MGELISQLLTPQFLLDWATMAVSLFNTIILLWLGITVLVNSERRAWGVWLAGGGLLLAGFFFVSHSAMLGHGLRDVGAGMDFWWQVGWVPVVTLPFAWYVVMLWYSGFWDASQTPLYRRHRYLFALATIAFVALAGLFLFANPLPSYSQLANMGRGAPRSIIGLEALAVIFPAYAVLCMGLAVDVVARPGPTDRLMGDLARRRARPWLGATSFVLLAVSLLVGGAIIWLVASARERQIANIYYEMEELGLLVRPRNFLPDSSRQRYAGAGYRRLRDIHRQDAAEARFREAMAGGACACRGVQQHRGGQPGAADAPYRGVVGTAVDDGADVALLRPLFVALLRRARPLHQQPPPLRDEPGSL